MATAIGRKIITGSWKAGTARPKASQACVPILPLWHHRRMLVYEERYHWTQTSTTILIGCGMLMIIGALAGSPRTSVVLQVLLVAAGGCGAFFDVLYPASRKVALRVDASGITLGGSPLRYKATTRVIPWPEVQGVFLWQRGFGRYLGVERTDEAPPLSPGGTGRADRTRSFSADPQVPPLTLAVEAPPVAWRPSPLTTRACRKPSPTTRPPSTSSSSVRYAWAGRLDDRFT